MDHFDIKIHHFVIKILLVHLFGIDFAGRILSDIDFVDGYAFVCDNLTDIITALETLASAAKKIGLDVNWTKTKILPVQKKPRTPWQL